MIVEGLHLEMVAMLGPQYIISPHDPNGFMNEDSLSKHNQHSSSMHDFDEVRSLPMIFSQDTLSFQFDF